MGLSIIFNFFFIKIMYTYLISTFHSSRSIRLSPQHAIWFGLWPRLWLRPKTSQPCAVLFPGFFAKSLLAFLFAWCLEDSVLQCWAVLHCHFFCRIESLVSCYCVLSQNTLLEILFGHHICKICLRQVFTKTTCKCWYKRFSAIKKDKNYLY